MPESIHQALGQPYDQAIFDRPWHLRQSPADQRSPGPPGKLISDIYIENGRQLLILGDPGSGKSHTLTQLARELLEQVETGMTKPIPVILNLSSFGTNRSTFSHLVLQQMSLQYGIDPDVTPALLNSGQLCLLLDGFDEVDSTLQDECITQINRFQQTHPVPLAVSSRSQDYEVLSTGLKIETAVLLQPLSDDQIMSYLTSSERQLLAVHGAIIAGDALSELAQWPLYLAMMTLAYRGFSPADLHPLTNNVEQRRNHLFQSYIQQTFNRPQNHAQASQIRRSIGRLVFLAQQQTQRRDTNFFLERLKPGRKPPIPHNLPERSKFAVITGLISGFLALAVVNMILGEASGLCGGLLVGLTIGLIARVDIRSIFNTGLRLPTSQDLTNFTRSGLGTGLIFGFTFGLFFWLYSAAYSMLYYELPPSVFAELPFSLLVGLVIGIIAGLLRMVNQEPVAGPILRLPTRHDIPGIIIQGLFFSLIYWLITGSRYHSNFRLPISLSGGFLAALLALINITPIGNLTWRSIGKKLVSLVLSNLGLALVFGLCIEVVGGLLFIRDVEGFFAIVLTLTLGTLAFYERLTLPAPSIARKRPGQDIGRSGCLAIINSLVMMLYCGVIGTLFGLIWGTLVLDEIYAEIYGLVIGLVVGVLAGLILGIVTGVYFYGGNTFLRYYLSRFFLSSKRQLPYRLRPFLDDMVGRLLLQRTGPSYRFIHPTLQTYFATLSEAEIEEISR
jgi:hypothetical protein